MWNGIAKLKAFLPRRRSGSSKEGFWSSFRWGRISWDHLYYENGMRLIQYGSNPVKFVLVKPEGVRSPAFMLQASWKIIYAFGTIRIGVTVKPLNLTNLWRSYENRTRTPLRAGSQLT